MEKFCIFCGQKPQSKNKEHVIPQWLIKLTGDPSREVYLGRKWATSGMEERKFSLKSFTFPSCEKCNESFSHLESQTQSILKMILSHSPISAIQWDTFLDWLDKIRIGLWLGMIYLNKNHRALVPMFYINQRIGSKDRLLIIYEITNDRQNGITWAGTETPLFEHTPSCFTLAINNFLFLNASSDFLFSYRYGFPYPSERKYRPEGGVWIEMQPGTKSLCFPLIKKDFMTGGTQLFQPIIPYKHFRTEEGKEADFSKFYNNTYVKDNCMDYGKGKGIILKRERNKLIKYPNSPSKSWIPKQEFLRGEILYQTGIQVGELLKDIFLDYPSFDSLEEKERKLLKNKLDSTLSLHSMIFSHFVKQKKMYYQNSKI